MMIKDKQLIHNFLNNITEQDIQVGDDESLLEAGLLTSFTMVQLLAFIQDRFSVTIEDEDLVPENFETIDAITNLLQKKVYST